MIGQIHIVGDRYYLQTNEGGTLEVLPRIKWYRQLWIYLLNYFGKIHSVKEVRDAWK